MGLFADAILNEEPFQRFATTGGEKEHRLMNPVEGRRARPRSTKVAPALFVGRLIEVGEHRQLLLLGDLLGRRYALRLPEQVLRPLNHREEACLIPLDLA